MSISRDGAAIDVGRFATRPGAELVLYDFGAFAVIYTIPIAGSLDDLLVLGEALYDNELLLANSREQVRQILAVIGDAAKSPQLSPLVEDYVIFNIERLAAPVPPDALCVEHGARIAQILRAERQPLSRQEIDDVLSARMAYGRDDLTIVDWNAALVVDPDVDRVRGARVLQRRAARDALSRPAARSCAR